MLICEFQGVVCVDGLVLGGSEFQFGNELKRAESADIVCENLRLIIPPRRTRLLSSEQWSFISYQEADNVIYSAQLLLLFVDEPTLFSRTTWGPPRFDYGSSIGTQFEGALLDRFAIALL